MDETLSSQVLLSEHNYFKALSVDAQSVEVNESATLNQVSESPSLTRLDTSKDNFETCLIQLLQAYTVNQRGSTSPTSKDSTPQPVSGEQSPPSFDISPESLTALSPEQVSTLVTSNSVNYEVIQQIMAQKHGYHGIPSRTGGAFGVGGPVGGGNNGGFLDNSSGQLSQQEGVASKPGGGGVGVSAALLESSGQIDLPKNSVVQITTEHLHLLQQQVNDLLRSKQVALPSDMTSQQQQMLIQSVLLKQLQLQQGIQREKQANSSGGSGNGGGGESKLPQSTGLTATKEKEESMDTSSTGTSIVASVKEAVPSSSSLESLLSSKAPSQAKQDKNEQEEKKKEECPSATVQDEVSPSVQRSPPSLPSTQLTTAPSPSPSPPLPSSSESSKQPSTITPASSITSSSASTTTATSTARTAASGRTSSRKKKGDSNKNEPKKPPMPYNIFFSEVYTTVLAANPKMTFADASRIISMMWNAMGTDVKQKYYDRHEELKEEYKVTLAKLKEQQQQQETNQSSVATEPRAASPTETGQEGQIPNAESAVESEAGIETMETSPQEAKDPSLCVNKGCANKAVFEDERGPQYCSNECVVMDTRNVFASWLRNRKIKVN